MRAFHNKAELAQFGGRVCCSYCGKNLETEHDWLLSCVDRVIPERELTRLGIDKKQARNLDNLVLCCTSCRVLSEDYTVLDGLQPRNADPSSLAEFRDKVFSHRKSVISQRRAWLLTQSPKTLSDFVKESVFDATRRGKAA